MHLVGESHDRIQTLQIDRQALIFIGNASVTRSAEHLGDASRLAELPNQRVFTPSAANDKNFHSETDKGMGRGERLSNCEMAIFDFQLAIANRELWILDFEC